jgi:hypothetical protein
MELFLDRRSGRLGSRLGFGFWRRLRLRFFNLLCSRFPHSFDFLHNWRQGLFDFVNTEAL